jgi:transposase
MELPCDLDQMNAQQLRDLTASLIQTVNQQTELLKSRQLKIDQLTHEMATLKRWRFARRSEQIDAVQRSLLEESIDEDLQAIELELETLRSAPDVPQPPKEQPRRAALPANLPRVEFHHEPEHTQCTCGCALDRFGEDVSEKLDYTPGIFEVHRHVRGKWVCRRCEKLIQAPVPPQVIDKGIPTAGLLAHILVAKYADHQPLYRLEGIFERSGVALARSSLAQWVGACGVRLEPLALALKAALLTRGVLHADETPVPMLKPGLGRTHRSYLWSYGSTQFDSMAAVIYDFADSRSGKHAQAFFNGWSGKLVCDDYSGYKALFEREVVEVGCLAHARRKFHDLHENHRSQIAADALVYFRALYDVETRAREKQLDAIGRQRLRQMLGRPIADSLHQWLILHRQKVPEGSATAKAIDYSLKRWEALMRYLDDGDLPIDKAMISYCTSLVGLSWAGMSSAH